MYLLISRSWYSISRTMIQFFFKTSNFKFSKEAEKNIIFLKLYKQKTP